MHIGYSIEQRSIYDRWIRVLNSMESKSGLYQNLDNSLKTDVISEEITFPEIDGLIYVSNFISSREHDELIAWILLKIKMRQKNLFC